jgi:two-component system sensor histidine kinase KdpD
VEQHLNFARNLHIEARILGGEPVAPTLIDFARRNQVTQIFLARPGEKRRGPWLERDLVQSIVSLAKDMQVVIVSEREPAQRR